MLVARSNAWVMAIFAMQGMFLHSDARRLNRLLRIDTDKDNDARQPRNINVRRFMDEVSPIQPKFKRGNFAKEGCDCTCDCIDESDCDCVCKCEDDKVAQHEKSHTKTKQQLEWPNDRQHTNSSDIHENSNVNAKEKLAKEREAFFRRLIMGGSMSMSMSLSMNAEPTSAPVAMIVPASTSAPLAMVVPAPTKAPTATPTSPPVLMIESVSQSSSSSSSSSNSGTRGSSGSSSEGSGSRRRRRRHRLRKE